MVMNQEVVLGTGATEGGVPNHMMLYSWTGVSIVLLCGTEMSKEVLNWWAQLPF